MPDHDEQTPDLLTAEKVREILNVKSVRTVYKLAARHHWKFQRTLSPRCVRYERRGLLRWLKHRPRQMRKTEPIRLDNAPAPLHTCAEERRDPE